MEDGNENPYLLPLRNATILGQWSSAERIFDCDPDAVTSPISRLQETALHMAIRGGRSNIEFVRKLVEKMPADSLGVRNIWSYDPLHYAALSGNTEAARILVEKNPQLIQARTYNNDTPLHLAAQKARNETVSYLVSVAVDKFPSALEGEDGVRLMVLLITADFYSMAIDLLKSKPTLARQRIQREASASPSALEALAQTPKAFPSGSGVGRFQRLLCQYFADTVIVEIGFLQGIRDTLLREKQAMELLRLLISEASKTNLQEAHHLVEDAVLHAATLGIHEFVAESFTCCPGLLTVFNYEGRNIFHLAVKFRQENIFNLLHSMGICNFLLSDCDFSGNTLLHLAATLAPSNKISGAALQMQRELRWFKEVEKFVPPSYEEWKNVNGRTPRMLFTEEHKGLVEQGEKWMKDTASSCATVAALVVTVVFAAAFTVPGGNRSDLGIPIYLNQTSFMMFAVSDVLALISSSTSLLMFLGILTSRYSEEDFLRALPMRLSIGLITLFFSIAAMLAAFCSAFYLVLFQEVHWIAVPIGLVACAPVTLFALLQFPLLVEIVNSTFGPSILVNQSQDTVFN